MGQLFRVQQCALGDELAGGHVIFRMVDGFDRKQFSALEVAYTETARGRISPQHLLVVILRETYDEQLIVELYSK